MDDVFLLRKSFLPTASELFDTPIKVVSWLEYQCFPNVGTQSFRSRESILKDCEQIISKKLRSQQKTYRVHYFRNGLPSLRGMFHCNGSRTSWKRSITYPILLTRGYKYVKMIDGAFVSCASSDCRISASGSSGPMSKIS